MIKPSAHNLYCEFPALVCMNVSFAVYHLLSLLTSQQHSRSLFFFLVISLKQYWSPHILSLHYGRQANKSPTSQNFQTAHRSISSSHFKTWQGGNLASTLLQQPLVVAIATHHVVNTNTPPFFNFFLELDELIYWSISYLNEQRNNNELERFFWFG